MSILPKNERKQTIDVPKNFFIYGATMSGKSYLAEHFPSPLFLNTDGNALANPFPNIQLRNIKGEDGKLKRSVLTDIDEIMAELQAQNHNSEFQYKTIVIDVIDDVCQLIEQAVCESNNVTALADIGYGKGYAIFNTVLNNFVLNLKSLGLNIVYVSRVEYVAENNDQSKIKEVPSLKTKYYNLVNGNCDLVIHTQKIGKNYMKTAGDIRKKYYVEDIKDPKIARILKEIPGALFKREATKPTAAKQTAATTANTKTTNK
ncbi:MAG: ATP-binding protein [Apilactobacillus sp.]|nr:ATP-binding protein [Apilactobacillus sp.]